MLVDSLWYQRYVCDQPPEYLPPIARAMKNMIDNDTFIWNSPTQIANLWPHFINQYRIKQDKASVHSLSENNELKLPLVSTDAISKTELNLINIGENSETKIKPDEQLFEETNKPIQSSVTNLSHSIDNQYLLKPPVFSPKLHTNRTEEVKHQSSRERSYITEEMFHMSTLILFFKQILDQSKSRNRTKTRDRKSRTRYKHSKSKRKTSPRRSKSINRKSSTRSKTKKRSKSKHRKLQQNFK